jgi:hypothetical protein
MRRLIAAVTLALTLGCSLDNSTSTVNTDVAGTYALQTINGSTLPFSFVSPSGTDSLTVTTDTLLVGTNGAWSEAFAFRQTLGGVVTTGTQVDSGVWFTNGSQIEFDSTITGTVVYTGTFQGGALLLSDGNSAQVFAR